MLRCMTVRREETEEQCMEQKKMRKAKMQKETGYDTYGGTWSGSITVFLSLLCIIFFSLICTAAESARIQGARTQTANIAGMATFSVLGEFEKALLEDYEIFAVDGAYGSGSFKSEKVKNRLEYYLKLNTDPKEGVFSVWCFDPWNLELTDTELTGYALLTDDFGEPFYQQAVRYMKTNAASLALDHLKEYSEHTNTIQRWEKEYEKRRKENDGQLSGLEDKKKQKLEQLESEAAENGTEIVEVPKTENPLKAIAKLRRKSTLEIVTGGKKISKKKVRTGKLPSKHRPKSGTLKLKKENSGFLANTLFREYLMLHFPNYLSSEKTGKLDYQIEYLLGGKVSDKKNLKYVVNRLLLIREGMNYLYALEAPEMNGRAEGLAVTLTGFLGMPALTAATKHALLLAWAYGESLIDVRTLLDDGKVPLFKDAGSWKLTLENLGRITEILEQGNTGETSGLSYAEYLRILLNLGSLTDQKMRALDMIQCNLRENPKSADFYAANCVVGTEMTGKWKCAPVFFRVPSAFLGVSSETLVFEQQAGMAY